MAPLPQLHAYGLLFKYLLIHMQHIGCSTISLYNQNNQKQFLKLMAIPSGSMKNKDIEKALQHTLMETICKHH